MATRVQLYVAGSIFVYGAFCSSRRDKQKQRQRHIAVSCRGFPESVTVAAEPTEEVQSHQEVCPKAHMSTCDDDPTQKERDRQMDTAQEQKSSLNIKFLGRISCGRPGRYLGGCPGPKNFQPIARSAGCFFLRGRP